MTERFVFDYLRDCAEDAEDGGYASVPTAALFALLDAVEAARRVTDALEAAMKAHSDFGSYSRWTQSDYDDWDAARNLARVTLARFGFQKANAA